jgi:hypothetical protein
MNQVATIDAMDGRTAQAEARSTEALAGFVGPLRP